jgi:hypothetical protein
MVPPFGQKSAQQGLQRPAQPDFADQGGNQQQDQQRTGRQRDVQGNASLSVLG